jgi:serine protease AprX
MTSRRALSRLRTRIAALVLAPLTAAAFLVGAAAPAHAATPGMWVYFHLADKANITDVETFISTMATTSYPDFQPQFMQLEIQSGFLAYVPSAMSSFFAVNNPNTSIPGTSCATSDTMWTGGSRFFNDSGLNPAAAPYDPTKDGYSAYNAARSMHADAFWAGGFRGKTHAASTYPGTTQTVPAGSPIDVALIDTGVSPVGSGGQSFKTATNADVLGPISGLDAPGAVVNGPDFSLESQSPDLTHLDAFGHGTAMAGIIHTVAPDARIINLKVGDATGAADPTQVIAAIDWAREHRNKFGLNIRVINLSYGVLSANTWQTDELSKAVDRAWQAGIVVVVAVGNYNDDPTTQTYGVASPAYNKNVLAVSAYDSTVNYLAKGVPTDFSNTTGANSRIPDVAAPGAHVTSWRVPNAQADNAVGQELCNLIYLPTTASYTPSLTYPIFTDAVGRTWIRGSGTSQATALASGAAALMLSAWPQLKPDELKKMLRVNAQQLSGGTRTNFGDGGINLAAVYSATPPYGWTYSFGTVTGGAPIEGSRGGYHLIDENFTQRWLDAWTQICALWYPSGGCPPAPAAPVDLSGCTFAAGATPPDGEQPLCGGKDIFGHQFAPALYAAPGNPDVRWTDTAWGQSYNGERLVAGPAVDANGNTVGFAPDPNTGQLTWPSVQWSGTSWGGAGLQWNTNWTGSRWVGSRWVGSRWVDGSWSGSRWVGEYWDGSRWVGSRWVGSRWVADSWSSAGWR